MGTGWKVTIVLIVVLVLVLALVVLFPLIMEEIMYIQSDIRLKQLGY